MVAIGYTSKGERKEYDCSDRMLYCCNEDLVSLEIPEGVEYIWCQKNSLTELIIPNSVIELFANINLIMKLNINNNNIQEIWCDRNVKGLENIDIKCEIILR